ncbi:MAG TPA: FliA/WhiG family RNA polymerase sigma factor [Bryobacteraceae bacterium]|nr:FliA/WhiG family RNA polymerase sigma factor [Bryobacteraceae bacterium]
MTTSPSKSNCLTPDERERVILEHMQQVKWIAANVHERLPDSVLEEDLISAGTLGLILAVDNFDPSHNASLRTYAEHRIRGAILDCVRALDGVPARRRRRAKIVQAAVDEARQRCQGMPREEDMARELGLSVAEYREALCDIRGTLSAPLETASTGGETADRLRYIADRAEASPGWIVERESLRLLLTQAIGFLPKVERTVVGLYYLEELSLAEIGRVLDMHTSRVCQLKRQAILRLRSYMAKKWPSGHKA